MKTRILVTFSCILILFFRSLAIAQVDAPRPEFIDSILVSPQNLSVSTSTPLNLRIGRVLRGDIKKYKFKLLQLQTINGTRQWVTVQNYQAYPLKPFKSKYVGPSALQVNILGSNKQIQMIWLGNYYFHAPFPQYPSLLRSLIADDFDNLSLDKQFLKLAEELAFFTYVKTDKSTACRPNCIAQSRWRTRSATFPNSKYQYHKSRKTMSEREGATAIYLDKFTQFDELLHLLKEQNQISRRTFTSQDVDVILSVFAAQLMYRGYMTGTPPRGYIYDLSQSLSMCNIYSYQLIEVLKHYGIDTDFVSYESEVGSAHAFVQVKLKHTTILLDALQGRIYFGSVQDLVDKKNIVAIDLPRYSDHGIDLIKDLPVAKAIAVSDEIISERGQAAHYNAVFVKKPQ